MSERAKELRAIGKCVKTWSAREESEDKLFEPCVLCTLAEGRCIYPDSHCDYCPVTRLCGVECDNEEESPYEDYYNGDVPRQEAAAHAVVNVRQANAGR